jgi:FixJ family two-component response regulator
MRAATQYFFTGFIRDLTERQQTEARLQELQAELVHVSRLTAMGEMASALAHANKQIAYDLGIGPRTVEIYRANLMNKMDAGSLSELVRMALVAGMLESV